MKNPDKEAKRQAARRLKNQTIVRSQMILFGASEALKHIEDVDELDAIIEVLSNDARKAQVAAEEATTAYYSNPEFRRRRRTHHIRTVARPKPAKKAS
jgi:hypothetical protein